MKLSGEILAILSALFIGIAIPLSVLSSKEFGVIQVAVYSSLVSVVFLLILTPFINFKTQIKKSLTKYFKESISITVSRAIIGSLLFFYGVSLTTSIRTAFMLRLEPIFVTILSYIFLKYKVSLRQIALIALMIFGAFLLSTSGSIEAFTQTQIGDLFIILSLLFFSYCYIPIKRIGKEISPITITIINNLVGGLILFIIMLFLPLNLLTVNSSNIWLLLAYVISFFVFGLYFYFAAVRKTKPWIVSSLLSFSSVVGSAIAYFWLGETLNIIQILGVIVILISTWLIIKK